MYTRIQPCDLQEVATDQGGTTTLASAITAMQTAAGVTFNCPKCNSTGWQTTPIGNSTKKMPCSLCGGLIKTKELYVADPNNVGNFITPLITGTTHNIKIGSSASFVSNVLGGTWAVDNTAFATVNATGVVTGVAAGTCNLTYTVDGYTTKFVITVS